MPVAFWVFIGTVAAIGLFSVISISSWFIVGGVAIVVIASFIFLIASTRNIINQQAEGSSAVMIAITLPLFLASVTIFVNIVASATAW